MAALPYTMPADGSIGPGNGQLPMGIEAPSNIAHGPAGHPGNDGYYYAIVQVWNYSAQVAASAWGREHGGFLQSGNCVIRTRDLTDPGSWRGWRNGTGNSTNQSATSPSQRRRRCLWRVPLPFQKHWSARLPQRLPL